MKIELVSYALCPFVHRATILLHEKNAEFDVSYIDLKQKPEWFLAISPRGKVPVLVADGVPIFESTVIMEFLDETHLPRMLPDDPIERARQRAWLSVADDLFSHQYKLVTAPSKEDFDHSRLAIDGILARLGDALCEPYFAGDGFGFIDVAVAPAMYRFQMLEELVGVPIFESLSKVEQWARRLAVRPSVIHGVPDDFSSRFRDDMRSRGGYLLRHLYKAA